VPVAVCTLAGGFIQLVQLLPYQFYLFLFKLLMFLVANPIPFQVVPDTPLLVTSNALTDKNNRFKMQSKAEYCNNISRRIRIQEFSGLTYSYPRRFKDNAYIVQEIPYQIGGAMMRIEDQARTRLKVKECDFVPHMSCCSRRL